MAGYRLSRKAAKDIDVIYEYGIITFGYNQARSYILELEKNFTALSKTPNIGRKSVLKIANLYQFQFKAHTVFYYKETDGIKVLRVLGSKMDFERYL